MRKGNEVGAFLFGKAADSLDAGRKAIANEGRGEGMTA
jgi:hypothetical protein